MGIGGADAYTLGLIRYMHNVEHVGLFVGDHPKMAQVDWALQLMGYTCPVHQAHDPKFPHFPGINYHDTPATAIYSACEDADIVVSWGFGHVKNEFHCMRKPVVEVSQNQDSWFRHLSESNNDVDFTVAVSKEVAKQVYGGDCDAVLYNAVDPGRVTPRWGREQQRKLLGLDTDDRLVLFMGRYVEEKNPCSLVHALQFLPDNYKVLFVGRGYRDEDLILTAQQLQVQDRVMFMEPQYHVGDLLAAADVFCLPTDFEGHPLSVCEAWLAGCPTLLSDLPVYNEFEENDAGETFSWKISRRAAPQQLAAALQRPTREDPRVAVARELAWQHFCLPRAAFLWEEFLQECTHKWRRAFNRPVALTPPVLEPLDSCKTRITHVELMK